MRSDATSLSDEDIRDIINAKDLMNRASEVIAKKYKISPRRVYQIWRGEHPPIAPILVNAASVSAIVFDATGTARNLAASSSTAEMIEIKDDDLKAFYERETQRDQKNIERFYS